MRWAKIAAAVVLSGALLITIMALALLQSPSIEPYSSLIAKTSSTPADLTVRFMGTATISFTDGETTLVEDGFFSRPGIIPVLFGKIAPNEKRIDDALRKAEIGTIDAIFVAHSHYDHVLDTGLVALKTGATVLGTSSTAMVVEGAGLAMDRTRVVKDGEVSNFGKFKLTAFETPHSPNPTSIGTIDRPVHTPASQSEFKEGGNFSYLVEHGKRLILVIASCNFAPGKFKDIRADVVFLGIGALGAQPQEFAEGYWHEAVQQTGAKLVIPVHWDNFFKPLDESFSALPRKLDDFESSMKILITLAKRDGVTLRLPAPFAQIDLDQR